MEWMVLCRLMKLKRSLPSSPSIASTLGTKRTTYLMASSHWPCLARRCRWSMLKNTIVSWSNLDQARTCKGLISDQIE